MGPNLAGDLELRARASPDVVGLIVEDGCRWTYRELDQAAGAVARTLQRRGVAPGQRVGLHLANGPELVVLLAGCWKVGVVPVVISALYQRDELRKAVATTAPVLLVGDARHREALTALAADGLPGLLTGPAAAPGVEALGDLLRGQGAAVPALHVSPEHEGFVLFTGGTTGTPKAVAVTHAGAYGSMATLARASKGGRSGPFPTAPPAVSPNLIALPLFHGGGLQSLLFALHVGRAVVLMERFRVDGLARLVATHRIDNLFLLPTMIYDLVHAREPVNLSPVRQVLVAGQALDPHLRRVFEERFQVLVLSNYGSAETGHVAGWTAADIRGGRWKPGAAGRVYDGVEVEIRDEAHQPLPPGSPGEICVRTDRTRGYVEAGEVDGAGLVRDGWVYSGDIGYLDPDGVLYLVGRKRELIKTGGFQVWPAEIEAVLRAHPAVSDVAVVGVPDPRLGEIPVAFVVPTAEAGLPGDPLAQALREWTRERLAHFKAVRRIEFLGALPRSEVGKIQRADLVQLSAGPRAGSPSEKTA